MAICSELSDSKLSDSNKVETSSMRDWRTSRKRETS